MKKVPLGLETEQKGTGDEGFFRHSVKTAMVHTGWTDESIPFRFH